MRFGNWKVHAEALKNNTYALYLASKHPRTPLLAKLVVLATVAYALSPLDLIPDFIPILGYLDDLILLPAGIWLALRLLPASVWVECQERAAREMGDLPRSRAAAAVVIVLWVLLCTWLIFWIWNRHWT